MLIYQRYIITTLLRPLLLCIVVLAGIAWLSQVLKFLYLFDRGITVKDFLEVIGFILPSLIHVILPFATLYSCLYGYYSLKNHKELIILETAGLSQSQLIAPLLKFGLILAVLGLLISSYIMPITYSKLKNSIFLFRNNYVTSFVKEGVFTNITKHVILYADRKLTKDSFAGLILFDYQSSNNPNIIFAKQGVLTNYNNNLAIELYHGQRQQMNENNHLELMSFEKLSLNLAQNVPLKRDNRELLELFIPELLSPSDHVVAKFGTKLIAEGHHRLLWPAFSLLLPLIGISVFLKGDFSRGSDFKNLVKSFLIAMIFTVLHFICYNIAGRNPNLCWLLYLNIACALIFSRIIVKSSRCPI